MKITQIIACAAGGIDTVAGGDPCTQCEAQSCARRATLLSGSVARLACVGDDSSVCDLSHRNCGRGRFARNVRRSTLVGVAAVLIYVGREFLLELRIVLNHLDDLIVLLRIQTLVADCVQLV